MTWKGFKDVQATIVLEIENKKIEDVLKEIRRDRKRNLKKALKYNLRFEKVLGLDKEWDIYYRIHKKTYKEGGIKAINLNYLKQFSLFFLVFNGKIIGGAAIDENKEGLGFVSVVVNKNFDYVKPNDFLYYNLIKYAIEKNKKFVDFGGYQLKAHGKLKGINEFKESWGGQIKKYCIYSKNPFYILGRKIIRNCYFLKKLKDSLTLFFYK